MAGSISCYSNSYSNDRSNASQKSAQALEETSTCYTGYVVQLVLASACSLLSDKRGKPTVVKYPMNDMGSVYTHFNPKTGRNEATPNKLKGGESSDGTNGK